MIPINLTDEQWRIVLRALLSQRGDLSRRRGREKQVEAVEEVQDAILGQLEAHVVALENKANKPADTTDYDP